MTNREKEIIEGIEFLNTKIRNAGFSVDLSLEDKENKIEALEYVKNSYLKELGEIYYKKLLKGL